MNLFPSIKLLRYLCVLVTIGLVAACGTPPPRTVGGRSTTAVHAEVVSLARELIGTPYHYGGRSPKQGFDCSGLVYYTHLEAGLRLPRTSYGQYKVTLPVSLGDLIPGDLVFFRMSRHRISHVGIYVGHHKFIHAPSRGKDVMVDDLDDPYWRRHFVRGGRTHYLH